MPSISSDPRPLLRPCCLSPGPHAQAIAPPSIRCPHQRRPLAAPPAPRHQRPAGHEVKPAESAARSWLSLPHIKPSRFDAGDQNILGRITCKTASKNSDTSTERKAPLSLHKPCLQEGAGGTAPRSAPDPPRRGRGAGGAGGEEFPRGATFVLSGSCLTRYATPKRKRTSPGPGSGAKHEARSALAARSAPGCGAGPAPTRGCLQGAGAGGGGPGRERRAEPAAAGGARHRDRAAAGGQEGTRRTPGPQEGTLRPAAPRALLGTGVPAARPPAQGGRSGALRGPPLGAGAALPRPGASRPGGRGRGELARASPGFSGKNSWQSCSRGQPPPGPAAGPGAAGPGPGAGAGAVPEQRPAAARPQRAAARPGPAARAGGSAPITPPLPARPRAWGAPAAPRLLSTPSACKERSLSSY